MNGTNPAKSDAPKTWGISSAEFYATLANKPAQIHTLDGKIYKGVIVGVDLYDIALKQSSGLVILVAKHSIKMIHADAPGSERVKTMEKILALAAGVIVGSVIANLFFALNDRLHHVGRRK